MSDDVQANAPRGHILTVTQCEDFDPEYPSFEYSIECRNVDKCGGWQECREPHEVDGVSAADGPWDCDDDAPWEGLEELEFHGVLHTWHWGHGWTVPYPGCVVAANDAICDDAHDIALDHGCGRHEVDDDWDDEDCRLIHVRAIAS
ncbi:hypothetical protein [Gordonia sp. SCSIO 19800]|uniref:hypothetical protein n=1 Tax=Gordonia sp. SCSIO 19800 TaxID=2826926 RepID=UPI001B82F072|nr:hypothetical protein [Gordonia sp. SCSIO 19800]MBR7191694.1 hypothetical protein [Gordonia sp. SCSIO 19800]